MGWSVSQSVRPSVCPPLVSTPLQLSLCGVDTGVDTYRVVGVDTGVDTYRVMVSTPSVGVDTGVDT